MVINITIINKTNNNFSSIEIYVWKSYKNPNWWPHMFKIVRHDIAEILFKVALNTKNQSIKIVNITSRVKHYIFGIIWHGVYSSFYCRWSDMLEVGLCFNFLLIICTDGKLWIIMSKFSLLIKLATTYNWNI